MKILIIQLARLGDIMQTARLVASLQQNDLHLCVDQSLVKAAQYAYPTLIVHGVMVHSAGETTALSHNTTVFARLRDIGFHQIYNLNHSGFNRAMARLFPSERVDGYSCHNGQNERSTWMRLALRWTSNRRFSPLNLVDFWGLMAQNPIEPAQVNPIATARGGGLGVAIAGRNARRSLPPHLLVKAITAIVQRNNASRIVLLGTANERAAARALYEELPPSLVSRVENRVGRTSLAELFSLIAELDVLLSPDTGLTHIAARLGVPVEGLFLSSAWAFETGPYGLGHRVWQATTSCAPCAEHTPCNANHVCLKPFTQASWLRDLLTENETTPHLQTMTSRFDALGLTWSGASPIERQVTRRVLATYCGVCLPIVDTYQEAQVATQLFETTDWVLPKTPCPLSETTT